MEVKDVEDVTMVPFDDGQVAYVDKSGAIFMYSLKEEFLENQLGDNGGGDPTTDQADPEFIFTNMFPDQVECTSFVLDTSKGADFVTGVDAVNQNHSVIVEEENIEEAPPGTILNLPQVEEDCVEQVTMFKCRACLFTAPEKNSIVHHYTQEHVQRAPLESEVSLSLPGTLPVQEEFERLAQSITEDSTEGVGERLLFLCGKCQSAFETIELCRQHMIQEHKYVSGKNKGGSKPAGNSSLSSVASTKAVVNSLPTSSFPSAIDSPIMTVMDVGGIKVEWQPLALANCSSNAQEPSSSLDTGEKATVAIPTPSQAPQPSSTPPSPLPAISDPKSKRKKNDKRERKIKCTFRSCPFKFTNQKALQIHKSCHSKNPTIKEFHCIHCEEKFVRWRMCSTHLWREHEVDVDLLTCPVCMKYKTSTPMKLEIHMRTHGDQRPYPCQHCGKGFKQSAQLRNHCISVHLEKKSVDSVKRWYMEQCCTVCGKTYADAKCLKKHIQAVHSKIKPYVCTVCGHSSACRAMLALHLRQHTGEKPHACKLCDYRTGDHNTLRRHMMRHTGHRQYKCPHCPYSSIQSNSLKTHIKSRHPGEAGMFSCPNCSYQTVRQDLYHQHIADHQKGLIPPKDKSGEEKNQDDEMEYFPGNVAAAHLVYRYLGTFLQEPGHRLPAANVTESQTSADGTTQSITIQIPTREESSAEGEDEESSHSFLLKGADDDVGIDTGGITIPAEPSDLTSVES